MSRGIKLITLVALLLFPVLIWAQTGSISGTVTEEAGSLPLLGVHVMAKSGSGPYPHMTLGEAVTDSNGNYIIENLPTAADYVVLACKLGYECEFYDNSPTLSGATIVHVTDGATTSGINFSLTPSLGGGTGAISGTVIDQATSLPLPGVAVAAKSTDSTLHEVGAAMTDMNGHYLIPNLTEGDYYVAACKPGYLCEFYDNVTDIPLATVVHVTAGGITPGINFALTLLGGGGPGTISGTVTDSLTGQAIFGAKVLAFNNLGMHFKACTDSLGHYSMTVPAGSYALVAWAHDYHPALYPSIVSVAEGETVTVDFQLIPFAFGAIAGHVTDAQTDSPIFHALQIAKKIHGRGFGWGFSDSSGNYLIEHLPPGFYHVASIAHGYHLSIYPDSVAVLPFATTPGINFQLVSKPDSSGMVAGSFNPSVSGTVYDDSTGLPLNFALVVLVGKISENGFVIFVTPTDNAGSYTFNNLPILNYYALAWSPGYKAELYNDAHSIDSATLVTPPQSGVDFYLAKCSDGPWTINGKVVVGNLGTGLAGVIVNAFTPAGELVASAYTLPSGDYTLEGLDPGTYTVKVSSYSGTAGSQEVVVSNDNVNSVDFVLAMAGAGLRGDVDSDGNITLADVISIVNYIFKRTQFPPTSVYQADVNCNDTVSLADVIHLANYILKKGTSPCSP